MYPNLELEMFKRNITSRQLAQACGISECAMRNKRKGRAEAGTLPKAIQLCEDFEELMPLLANLTEDALGRTAVEVYQTALRTVIQSAKEHL